MGHLFVSFAANTQVISNLALNVSYFLQTGSIHYGHWFSKQTVSMFADDVVMCN